MSTWSSPHPITTETRQWLQSVGFKEELFGRGTDLVLFNTPDQALILYKRMGFSLNTALLRFSEGCQKLISLKNAGLSVESCWFLPPTIDPILAGFLSQWIDSNPEQLKPYLKLDPTYPSRIKEQQITSIELIDKLISERLRGETLLEQHLNQQQKCQSLLATQLRRRKET